MFIWYGAGKGAALKIQGVVIQKPKQAWPPSKNTGSSIDANSDDLQMPKWMEERRHRRFASWSRIPATVPIIALSASPAEEMESSLQAGIDDYITKPIARKLKSVLKEHLNRHDRL